MDIFLTCRLSKSLAWALKFIYLCRVASWEFWGRYLFFLAVTNLRGKLCQKFFQKQSQSAIGHNTDPVSRAAPSSQTWKNAPARLVVVTGFCRSVARHVAWQHKHRSVELIALFFNTVSNVLKKRERKKTQWPVTWPPYNSEGCEGSTL